MILLSVATIYNILTTCPQTIMPGPPFAFGAILVILALLVSIFIPERPYRNSGETVAKSPTRRSPTLQMELFQRDTGTQTPTGVFIICTSVYIVRSLLW